MATHALLSRGATAAHLVAVLHPLDEPRPSDELHPLDELHSLDEPFARNPCSAGRREAILTMALLTRCTSTLWS